MEAEYMADVEADKEILWMKDFIGELDIWQDEYRLYCDSQSAIHLAKNAVWGNMSLRMEPDGRWRKPAHHRTGPDRYRPIGRTEM